MSFARPVFAVAGLAGLLIAAASGRGDANAQQIYRIQDPDGKVTFSDKAPVEPSPRATTMAKAVPLPPGDDNGGLPFQLREVAARFPVTLYTGAACEPCTSGRAMLSARGIPFAEKTVASNEDIEALKRLSGAASVPFLTVGGQQLKGFSEIEWTQFLDAAGYPKTSQLPAGYSPPPPAPLVAAQAPRPPSVASGQQQQQPRAALPAPMQAPGPSADNPAGIRF